MAKTKAKKSTRTTKAPARSKASSAKKPSKSAAAKKASRPAATRSASSSGTAVAGSTDIRKAFKSYLLADYLGEKKPRAGSSRKAK